MDLLIFSFLTNLIFFCCGGIFFKTKNNLGNNSILSIFGAVYISSIALIINFFFPLNLIINSTIYLIIIIIFFIKKKFQINKIHIYFLLISSLLTFFFIAYDNVNRPDSGLYHLPYTSFLNENKIIFGLSNLHFRFGHVSILQYLSAINNNYLFFEKGIVIPLASLVSFFYIYFFYDIWTAIVKKDDLHLSKYFSLFICIYMSYKISRYSSFGNDAVAHLLLFYLISYILKTNLNNINLNRILLISIFSFLNKPMLGLIFIIPATIFILKKNYYLKNIFKLLFSIPSLILYFWFIKNIIISGCAIFPIKFTCIESFAWTDKQQVLISSEEGTAWTKAWPDRIDKKITMAEFNKNFNWISAWSRKHLIYIINIIIPYIGILTIITLYIKLNNVKLPNYNNKKLGEGFYTSLAVSGIGTLCFFLFFPLYRYGYSYLISLISLCYMTLIKNAVIDKKNKLIFKLIMILCLFFIFLKFAIKFINNTSTNIWPNIYTFDSEKKIYKKIKIKMNNNFIYYLAIEGDKLCMYSSSPCTTYDLKEEIYHQKKGGYSFLLIK